MTERNNGFVSARKLKFKIENVFGLELSDQTVSNYLHTYSNNNF